MVVKVVVNAVDGVEICIVRPCIYPSADVGKEIVAAADDCEAVQGQRVVVGD